MGFGLVWPKEVFPYVWFWQVYHGSLGHPWYGRTYNIALEPWSSYPPVLTQAIQQGTQMRLAPGQEMKVKLLAVAYAGLERVAAIRETGEVLAKPAGT